MEYFLTPTGIKGNIYFNSQGATFQKLEAMSCECPSLAAEKVILLYVAESSLIL